MRFKVIAAIAAGLIAAGLSAGVNAKVRTKSFDYKQASVTLEGYIAWDDAVEGKRAGVLVFPTYTGPSEFEQDVARKLAKLGYVVMVADIYGKGIRPRTGKEAGEEMAKYMGERTSCGPAPRPDSTGCSRKRMSTPRWSRQSAIASAVRPLSNLDARALM